MLILSGLSWRVQLTENRLKRALKSLSWRNSLYGWLRLSLFWSGLLNLHIAKLLEDAFDLRLLHFTDHKAGEGSVRAIIFSRNFLAAWNSRSFWRDIFSPSHLDILLLINYRHLGGWHRLWPWLNNFDDRWDCKSLIIAFLPTLISLRVSVRKNHAIIQLSVGGIIFCRILRSRWLSMGLVCSNSDKMIHVICVSPLHVTAYFVKFGFLLFFLLDQILEFLMLLN